jgi:hypothetical protein
MGRTAGMSCPPSAVRTIGGGPIVRPHLFQLCAGIRRPRRYRVDEGAAGDRRPFACPGGKQSLPGLWFE